MSYQECCEVVNKIIALLRKHGKSDQKIIVTVSPVPLARTFTADDIVVANTTSKNMLRVAVNELVSKHKNIDYFPSYEAVTLSTPELAWSSDRRHASDYVVGKVIGEFIRRYGADWYTLPENHGGTDKSTIGGHDTLIADMNSEINRYKNQVIRLQTEQKKFKQDR
jgi:hypothetical protein